MARMIREIAQKIGGNGVNEHRYDHLVEAPCWKGMNVRWSNHFDRCGAGPRLFIYLNLKGTFKDDSPIGYLSLDPEVAES